MIIQSAAHNICAFRCLKLHEKQDDKMVMIRIALVPFQILSIHSLCTEIVKYAHLCIYKSLQVRRRKKMENLKQKHGL